MQGWRGVGLAQELETSAKKKKESKHSTSVVVMHQRETCTSELTTPEPLFITYIHTTLLTQKGPCTFQRGKNGIFFWCWETSHPSWHLPPEQCHSPYTQSQQPLCPAHLILKSMTFCYNTNTEVVLPGLQKQVLLFSQSMASKICGCKPALSPLSERMFCLKNKWNCWQISSFRKFERISGCNP